MIEVKGRKFEDRVARPTKLKGKDKVDLLDQLVSLINKMLLIRGGELKSVCFVNKKVL